MLQLHDFGKHGSDLLGVTVDGITYIGLICDSCGVTYSGEFP